MALPAIVHCRESSEVDWSELTRLLDVTPFGASFPLAHAIEVGKLLQMTLPMPRQMRCFDHAADQYRVWALVRYVKPLSPAAASSKGKEQFAIGVAFVGKHPPESYDVTPSKLYQADEREKSKTNNAHAAPNTSAATTTTTRVNHTATIAAAPTLTPSAANEAPFGVGAPNTAAARSDHTNIEKDELREGTRLSMPVDIILEVIGERGPISSMREYTVTENLSRRGASVFTTFHIERGALVKLTSAHYQISVNAFVLARRVGADGLSRLHLRFTDQQWPLEGVE